MGAFAQKQHISQLKQSPQKTAPSKPNVSQELQLTIKLDNNAYKAGESIICDITLQNTSKKSLAVNTRMLVNDYRDIHDIYFSIIRNKTQELEFLPQRDADIEHDYYRLLAPQGSTKLQYSILARDYGITLPGNYTIQAFYENNSNAAPKLNLPTVWKGMISSNIIDFRME